MSSPHHLDPFLRYPTATLIGIALLLVSGIMYGIASFGIDPARAETLDDVAVAGALLGLWVLFAVGILIERRKKNAALILLVAGLFLLFATISVFPSLWRLAELAF